MGVECQPWKSELIFVQICHKGLWYWLCKTALNHWDKNSVFSSCSLFHCLLPLLLHFLFPLFLHLKNTYCLLPGLELSMKYVEMSELPTVFKGYDVKYLLATQCYNQETVCMVVMKFLGRQWMITFRKTKKVL